MAEWRLFPEGTVPDFSQVAFFEQHPWVPPHAQAGHKQRTAMVADLIVDYIGDAETLSDLGCGDGSLLTLLAARGVPLHMWGYDAGSENVLRAQRAGLNVERRDFTTETVQLGDITVMSEVLEHLHDPHGFLAKLPAQRLVVSSPSAETADWHYEHHAWAWDEAGYRRLIEDAGWRILDQRTCFGGPNVHGGRQRSQFFQAIAADPL